MTSPPEAAVAEGTPDAELRAETSGARALTLLRERALIVVLPVATAGAVLIAWEVAVRMLAISPVILPAPSQIYQKMITILPLLIDNSIQTGTEAVLGLLLAAALGIGLGVGLSNSKIFRAAVYPNMVFFQLIPKVALAPLFIIWLGIGIESRVAFTVFISFFPIAISTATGLASIDPIYVRFCRGLTATDWQIFTTVRVPFALPSIFNGLKIGVTMAFIGVIVGEFVTSQSGLGYLILFALARTETAVIFGSIAVLCLLGLAVYGAVALLEIMTRRVWGAPFDAG
jgi:NitT/TauT family transport system permease protein